MSRFLLNSYSVISEIALWLMFAAAAVSGGYLGGLGGVIIGLIFAFILAVFMVTPFMMIDDIRKSTMRLERLAIERNTSSGNIGNSTSMSPNSARNNEQKVAPGKSTRPKNLNIGDTIKVFKGKSIVKESNGVSVDGEKYPGLLAAEKAISKL